MTATTLATTVSGPEDAPVLVLGHSLGSSSVMWDGVAQELLDRVRLIRYDLPGHGRSPLLPLDRECRMPDILDALRHTLEGLGVQSFHLGGLSFGGLTALAAGCAHLPGLRSVTVMSSGPVTAPLSQWPEKIATVREHGTESLVDATFERWFSAEAPTTVAPALNAIRTAFCSCQDEGYAQVCEVLGATDLSAEVDRINVPTLLVSAEHDGGLPWEKADELAGMIRAGGTDVQVLRLAGVKHMSAVERPEEVAEALVRHVAAAE